MNTSFTVWTVWQVSSFPTSSDHKERNTFLISSNGVPQTEEIGLIIGNSKCQSYCLARCHDSVGVYSVNTTGQCLRYRLPFISTEVKQGLGISIRKLITEVLYLSYPNLSKREAWRDREVHVGIFVEDYQIGLSLTISFNWKAPKVKHFWYGKLHMTKMHIQSSTTVRKPTRDIFSWMAHTFPRKGQESLWHWSIAQLFDEIGSVIRSSVILRNIILIWLLTNMVAPLINGLTTTLLQVDSYVNCFIMHTVKTPFINVQDSFDNLIGQNVITWG